MLEFGFAVLKIGFARPLEIDDDGDRLGLGFRNVLF
jgi:hypothetical protein